MRVLVIDDSRAMRRLERDVLSELPGVSVVEAGDGLEGIHRLRDEAFQLDLILVDWTMPRMDGLTFVRHLKATPNLRSIPILMVTSCSDEARMRLAWKTGVDGYLLKPFTKELFLKAIVALRIEFTDQVEPAAADESGPGEASFLETLPDDLRSRIVTMSAVEAIEEGRTLLKAGEVPTRFCFLEQGKVTETRAAAPEASRGQREASVRTHGPGACFGVTELMVGDPLRADFVTAAPSRVGRMSLEVFEGMLEKFSGISLALSRHLAFEARELEVTSSPDESDLAGRLDVLDLPTLVQAINLRQKSCVIELPEIQAEIVFSSGQVIAVSKPGGEGEQAFHEIMEVNPQRFRVVVEPRAVRRNVHLPTTRLLLESARLQDERRATER
jgi:two-component system chemotaxis response regulator CheY